MNKVCQHCGEPCVDAHLGNCDGEVWTVDEVRGEFVHRCRRHFFIDKYGLPEKKTVDIGRLKRYTEGVEEKK